MKNTVKLFFLLVISFVYGQKKHSKTIGLTTKEELQLAIYDKDSTANSVVLEEHANVYVDERNNYKFRTDLYKRVKFFNKKDEEKATISVDLYKKNRIKNIKAVTYTLNGDLIKKVYLSDDNIFIKEVSENWREVTFTLPNISEGCVVEYSYSIINYSSGLKDWYFQSDIPKFKSEYRASIPGNWKYKTRIIGYQRLDKDSVFVAKKCLHIPGFSKAGDCVVTEYGMTHVPAFKEEDYMLSKKNFMSRLAFELETFTGADGSVERYTKTWKDADKTIQNLLFDKQTSKNRYFKEKLPKEFLTITNPLEKAKAIYYHIQKRMYWNERYWTSKYLKVKKVYDEKKGSVDAINLTLYNALKAFDIESYMVVLSTRNNGLPTKLFPAVDDFNYAIVKVIINGETYFLDATDKVLPFGEVPSHCLNGEGRVLDPKRGSYWEEIKPRFKTSLRAQVKVAFNENEELTGSLTTLKKGYFALKEKRIQKAMTKDDFLDEFETKYTNIEVEDIITEGLVTNEKPVKNLYQINLEFNKSEKEIAINPFVYSQNKLNPFKLKERNYPVDFGYTRFITQMFDLKIPEGYTIKYAPKSIGFTLPNKAGRYVLKVNTTPEKITLFARLNIGKKIFSNQEYYYLKEFFNKIINVEKELIVIEKK